MFQNLGVVRLSFIAALVLGFVVLLVVVSSRLTSPPMALLYGNLEVSDSTQVVGKLESLGVPYEFAGNGSQILVPRDQVLRLRMEMAGDGIPKGGSVGYEIFDDANTLGSTSFVQNVNMVRALEGELSRTIGSLSQIQTARVHLVMPKRQLFSREREEPTASVVLRQRGSAPLTKKHVAAILNLVATAVPGLKTSRISIVDDSGNLLARGGGDGDAGSLDATAADDMRTAYETNLARTLETLIEESVGPGQVRARVTADMDFDRITTSSEIYDPDGQVIRSTQTVEENADNTETSGEQPVTVGINLPTGIDAAGAAGSNNRSARTEETVNYEITKTLKSHVRESGTIKRLSVAVLVNGTFVTDADGKRTYTPRSAEEMAKMERLIRSATGFSEARGDTLELVNMRFAHDSAGDIINDNDPLIGLSKSDYFRIAEIFVLVIVTLLVILLVVRPLITRIVASLPQAGDGDENQMLSDHSQGAAPQLAPPTAGQGGDTSAGFEENQGESPDAMIDIAKVKGRLKAASIKKVGKIVDEHPDETLAIIRKWMYQEN